MPEARLQKLLDAVKGKWAGLSADDIEPTCEPGLFVIKAVCGCNEAHEQVVLVTPFGNVPVSGGLHHHHVQTDEKLWREVSEARDWPQKRWAIDESSA